MKNGIPYEGEIEWDSSNKRIVQVVNNELIAVAEGTVDIIAILADYPEIE